MLKRLRQKKTAKKVWIILALLIVPAFVLWGSGSLIRGKHEPAYAGRIFGKNIAFLEYKNAFDAARIAAIMQFGDSFSEIQKYLNLEKQAWERLILLYEAKRRNLKATDKEVIEHLKGYAFFQRKGQFDNKIYSDTLRYVFRTQPRIFEEQTRDNLMLSKLYKELTEGIKVNEEEVKAEYQKRNEEISLYYIASLLSDFVKNISPNEQDIRDYFSNNQLEFKQPVSFNLEYTTLDSEDKINELALRLNRKTDFRKIAKEMGANVKETGLFFQTDPIPGIGWSPEILNLVSKLKTGEYSSPTYIDKYYYILRLKERKEVYLPDLQDIKDKVKEKLIKARSEELAKEKITGCLKKLKELQKQNPKLIDFTKLAKEYSLKSDSTGMFKYGSYIEGIGASDKLWVTAKGLKEGEFSEVINMPYGFYIVKIKSKVAPDEKKFSDEKKEFSENLLNQKKEESFVKFMEELTRKSGLSP